MNQPPRLVRSLTRFDAVAMIVGNMIGIGIFTTTGYNAQYLDAPMGLFMIWLIGAVYAFCGALTYAELSTRFPHSGGDYLFLTHAYHPLTGFLFGWSTFTVTYPGSIAAIAIGFAYYFLQLLPPGIKEWAMPLPLAGVEIPISKFIAIGITFVLTWLNSRGIRSGAGFQNVVVTLGILVLVGFVAVGITSPQGDWSHFRPFFPVSFDFPHLSRWGVALVGVLFAYSGWTVLVYIAGEVKEPRKNIPFAMAIAVTLVGVLYLLVNMVYLYTQPLSQMSGDVEIGYITMKLLFGTRAGMIFSLMILIMVLSTLNSTILSGARIYYAMAKEGRFFSHAAEIDPVYHVPSNSLWLQFWWSVLLILLGTFDQILTYTVFVIVLFSFLAGIALFVLRRRNPGDETVYRSWGYPVITILYLIISLWLMVNTLYHRPVESLLGMGIVLIGIPFYYGWERRGKIKD